MTSSSSGPASSDRDLVSVVIPVYNGERFLTQAIDSVLAQRYSPLECIVVDDGSTDGSLAVARSYGERVNVIRRENGGVSRARNDGAAAAKGSYLAFLDADDVWLPEKLERQMRLLREHPDLGLVYCSMRVTDEALRDLQVLGCPPGDEALENALLMESPVMGVAQTALIPLDVFQKVGGFDPHLSTSADTDLGCRIALAHPVRGVDEPLVLYRHHSGQMHLDAQLTERDMLRVYERFFGSGAYPPLAYLRGRAYASLYFTLGLTYLEDRRTLRGLRYLMKALGASPSRASRLLGRVVQKRTAHRTRHRSREADG